jgi:hypothetical protein
MARGLKVKSLKVRDAKSKPRFCAQDDISGLAMDKTLKTQLEISD